MAKTVTLIRHAESNANRAGIWQGFADSGISTRGAEQIAALGTRHTDKPDLFVASDLPRTMATAAAIGSPIARPAWREFEIGYWQGLTSAEIAATYPGEIEAFFRGEDVAPGGGEMMSDFGRRVGAAFDEVVDALDDDGHAIVVTHGGVIWSLMSRAFGQMGSSARMIPSHNTGLTTFSISSDGTVQVSTFNDASHLDVVPTQFGPEGATVSIFRHGETEGNAAHLWQGHTDSPLTARGRDQVKLSAMGAPVVAALFTSPLGRAVETATILGNMIGMSPVTHDGLMELSFGEWENVSATDAAGADPELYRQIYDEGMDLARGRTGETFGEAGVRFDAAIVALASTTQEADFAVVSHGAVIRAYITHVLGLEFRNRDVIPNPRNTSYAQIRQTEHGPVLAAYNVAPHMDV